jgi:integrase
MTEDLRRLIVFMVNSYVRPTDIKYMQHQHIDVIEDEHRYLRLRIPPTKNHSDPIVTMSTAVDVYLRLKKYHDLKSQAAGTDYVFLPQYGREQRDYALKQLQRQFEILLWATGLEQGSDGEERTLYSLRHTCIMYRLLYGEGVNTLVLARNARTSVEMIDRFYAKPLSGEMNIDMLQSRRRKRRV